MRIAVFGIGAMGSLFGARLAPHADVTLIGHWPEQIAALKAGPVRVIRIDGTALESRIPAVQAEAGSPKLIDPVDIALILTKANKTEDAAAGAATILKPDGIAVTLQNGIGNYEILQKHVGDQRAALGTTTQGTAMVEAGVVKEGGAGLTHLAIRPEIETQIRALADLFERAGFKTDVVSDVSGLVWGKLAINAAINPLTALLRIPNGALLDSSDVRQVMSDAACEAASIAAALSIELPFPDPAARAEEVARLTGANLSSMLQDVLRGAPTEIDAICGAVVRGGTRLGIATPTNQVLYQLIKGLEASSSHRL